MSGLISINAAGQVKYYRRQFGFLTAGWFLFIVVILVGVLLSLQAPGTRLALGVLVTILMVVELLFMSLTVSVDATCVKVSFGVGLIRRRIPLDQIESAKPVRNRWWYGLGIRLTPHGWMWNIQGLDAVELAYTNGRCFRIGTADPEGLSSAISAACRGQR